MEGLPVLSEKDQRTILELIGHIAADTDDIAVHESMTCNFCHQELDYDRRNNLIGHARNCLYVRTLKLARRLGL